MTLHGLPVAHQEQYLTKAQLARLMNLSERTIERMVQAGMPSVVWARRSRRFLLSECVSWARQPIRWNLDARPSRGKWPEPDREYADILLGDPCCYCGSTAAQIDHIEPRAGGGPDAWENLTAACQSCNRSKGTRPLLTHLLRRPSGG